jgi:DNA-binding LacI/PurR family transcriptional regulator
MASLHLAAYDDVVGLGLRQKRDSPINTVGQAAEDEQPRRRAAPVMADVAVVAGVSHMTVSRVLNDPESVKPTTRARVQAAMSSLGYRPNTLARALATGRTRRIGVLALATALYGPTSTLLSVEAAARVAGYHLDIVRLRSVTRRSVAEAADGLQGRGVDGIIGITPHTWAPKTLQSAFSGLPLVAVEGTGGPLPTVAVDQEKGAVLATEHLLGLGHVTVWHVAGPRDWLEAKARLRAWRETLQRADRPVPPVLPGGWGVRSGYDAGRRLAELPGVTAVFVANDQMALGVLRALAEAGIRVPDEVSVVGFDDVPEAAYFTPPLTTVRQDFDAVGVQALKLLLEQMADGGATERHVVVEPRLVVRESAAAPP